MSVERSPKLITPYLAVYLFVISLTFYLTMNYWPQTNIDSMKKVRIDHGTTLSTISDKLNKKGLVSNKWVFEFLTKIKGQNWICILFGGMEKQNKSEEAE